MYFDLTNNAQRQQFREIVERMLQRGSIVRLTDEQPRTLDQNSFYQLLIAYFSSKTGIKQSSIRDTLIKWTICPDIFMRNGRARSSADLTRDEMRTVISRFQFWASTEAGVELPDSDDYRLVINSLRQVEEDREFIEQPGIKWLPK